jgi:hypothetical protein
MVLPAVTIARRIAVGIAGGTVLVLGLVMLVAPGPGIAGVLAGLGILAIEFAWARVWLQKIRDRAQGMARGLRNNPYSIGRSNSSSRAKRTGGEPKDSSLS